MDASSPFVTGDCMPDAPSLARRGAHSVGVRELTLVRRGVLDIPRILESQPKKSAEWPPLCDRSLRCECWYPSTIVESGTIVYKSMQGRSNDSTRPVSPIHFSGRATRDAAALPGDFPLIVVSHGSPGNRYLLSNLTEHLASHGFVVLAADHTDSVYDDIGPFESTLINRSMDIRFMISEVQKFVADTRHFLAGMCSSPANGNVGLVGFSMGGYGVVNVGGAKYNEQMVEVLSGRRPKEQQEALLQGFAGLTADSQDPRVGAVVAFAPWGRMLDCWTAEGMEGLLAPTLFVTGDLDTTSGYEAGVRRMFLEARNCPRYLLTYHQLGHNACPNPAPPEVISPKEYTHYNDPVWDMRKVNNVNQHFTTAFFRTELKGDEQCRTFLTVEHEVAQHGKWSVDAQSGEHGADHTYWPGFFENAAKGLMLEFVAAGNTGNADAPLVATTNARL